jgi:hypothetical protein
MTEPPEEESAEESLEEPVGESSAEESVENSPEEETWDVSLADLEDDGEPEPVEPGSPSIENVLFVVLGVLLTLAVIYRLVTLVGATVA